MTKYVNFKDASKAVVDSVFGGPQDASIWPNSGEVDDSDERYLAFVSPETTLSGAQSAQAQVIDAAYLKAIQTDVAYTTAGGVSKTFQADCVSAGGTDSQTVLFKATYGYDLAGNVPDGFTWKAVDNTLVPFTLGDLKALYAAMLTQGSTAFARKATLKAQIAAATTVEAVKLIVWDASA
ncbi:DUF4376 domain-containing protein [Robbsia andropogonis]|uniref:DUF4376 domain-containing protein n=1 Tax=Robbsia andropogonis TaxID=28092 RepID=UPI003D1EC622